METTNLINRLINEGFALESQREELTKVFSDDYDLLNYFGLFECEVTGDLHSIDYLVITTPHQDQCHIDECFRCDYSCDYFRSDLFEAIEVRPHGNVISSYHISLNHDQETDYYRSYNFVMVDGRVYDSDYLFFWDSDGEYHTESQPQFNADYHSTNVIFLCDSDSPKIGFEVEKEDDYILSKYTHDEIYSSYSWGKENDGSLDSNGFELVSPVYNLHETRGYFLKQFEPIKELLNAEFSPNCGGHINYSHPLFNSLDLFLAIKGYLPLLYALYSHRIGKTYCEAKSSNDLLRDRAKYQSINIKSQCLEFRIFPAVKNVKNLLWRIRLIQLIDLHKTSSPIEVIQYLSDFQHPLHLHLCEIFNYEKLFIKIVQTAKFAQQFEGLYTAERTLNEIESKLILTKKSINL